MRCAPMSAGKISSVCRSCVALWLAAVASVVGQGVGARVSSGQDDVWKGERVILIPSDYSGGATRPFLPDGRLAGREKNIGDSYRGRTGVVSEAKVAADAFGIEQRGLVVALDDSNEKVLADPASLVYIAEIEKAKAAFVGRTFWTRGPLSLYEASQPRAARSVEVSPTTKVQVTTAGPGVFGEPVELEIRLPDGRLSYFRFDQDKCVDVRFRPSCKANFQAATQFFDRDPHTMFPKWSPAIWKEIEKGLVAIGMTQEMVDAACGPTLRQPGAVIESGKLGTIYRCGPLEFLMEAGLVTKYVKQ